MVYINGEVRVINKILERRLLIERMLKNNKYKNNK
jgi:hypothetical protein